MWAAAGQVAAATDRVENLPRGYLSRGSPTGAASDLDLFRDTLSEFGYTEGQNLSIEYGWGYGTDAPLFDAAAELARLPVDVFVMMGGLAARMARV